MKLTTLDRALKDRKLLGLGDPSWLTWRACLKAAHGEPLTVAERQAFAKVAGGRPPPQRKVKQFVAIASRRSGKGRAAGALGTHASVLTDHSAVLAPGETGVVAVLSPTRAQSKIVQDYLRGYFEASPVLKDEIAEVTTDEIRLRNGVLICTLASDYRTLRGRTLLLALLDEASFLHDGTTAMASDIEAARALLPGLATTRGLLCILSSPYRRSGLVYQLHRDYFGKDDPDVLVVAGESLLFNPTLDVKAIEAARKADPESAASEWFGQFRVGLSQYLDDATIDAALVRSRPLELPPRPDVQYVARVDAAGGAGGGESYTIAVGHREQDGCCIVDAVRGMAGSFDPHQVTREFAALCRAYHVTEVVADNYAKEWVAQAWRSCGVSCRRGELRQSDVYLEALPLFTRGLVRLPDHAQLIRELRQLERVTRKFGKDAVDHPKNGSDDYAAVVCGALLDAGTAASALWQREHFLGVDGAAVALPQRTGGVFATVVANEREAAAMFFARDPRLGPLYVVDLISAPLTAALFGNVATRLAALHTALRCWSGAYIATTSTLAAEFERAGFVVAEKIDLLLKDEMLAMSCAVHVNADRVKVSGEALAQAETKPFLHGSTYDDGSAARLAFLCGVVLALDEGRTLRKPRAA